MPGCTNNCNVSVISGWSGIFMLKVSRTECHPVEPMLCLYWWQRSLFVVLQPHYSAFKQTLIRYWNQLMTAITQEHKKVKWAHINAPCWFVAPHAGAECTSCSAVSFSLVSAFRSVPPHYESWHGRWSLSVWLVSYCVCDIDHWGHRLDLSTSSGVNQVGSFIRKFVQNCTNKLSFFLSRQRQALGLWWGLSGCQYCRARRGGRSSWVQHVAAQLPVSLPWPDAVGEDSAVWWRLVPATVHGPGGVPDRERDGDAQQWAQFHERPDPISGRSDRQQTCAVYRSVSNLVVIWKYWKKTLWIYVTNADLGQNYNWWLPNFCQKIHKTG